MWRRRRRRRCGNKVLGHVPERIDDTLLLTTLAFPVALYNLELLLATKMDRKQGASRGKVG